MASYHIGHILRWNFLPLAHILHQSIFEVDKYLSEVLDIVELELGLVTTVVVDELKDT